MRGAGETAASSYSIRPCSLASCFSGTDHRNNSPKKKNEEIRGSGNDDGRCAGGEVGSIADREARGGECDRKEGGKGHHATEGGGKLAGDGGRQGEEGDHEHDADDADQEHHGECGEHQQDQDVGLDVEAAEAGEVRHDLVAAIKQQIADGTYETPEKLDLAVDRLLDEIA